MVSVCIATYNGVNYIREQLVSILCQLSSHDEIIISDDGSTDNTIDVLESIRDLRIKIIYNKGRHGVVPNFENALRNSTGDFIFFADQDDIWDEHKVARCMTALKDADLVVHNANVFYENGGHQDEDFFQLRHSGSGYWKNLYKNTFMGSCMAFRKEVKEYVLPFPRHILWHDMWIGLMVEKKGKTKFIKDKLLYYRRHENNVSATSSKSTFSTWKMLKYRLQMLYYTSIR
ncbi:MAG: glycosyltransferase family 2 protein [Bacteroidaceae bacterium]|nr:glycosyltransferase family 2 protein [Bacteroidaceae bacterium]